MEGREIKETGHSGGREILPWMNEVSKARLWDVHRTIDIVSSTNKSRRGEKVE